MMFVEIRRERLRELNRQRPMAAEILDFYTHLYDFLAAEREAFLVAAPDEANRALRQREGFPLLRGDCLQVDPAGAADFLQRMTEVLMRHGRGGAEDLTGLRDRLAAGGFDLPLLFRAALDRDRRPLMAAAEAGGINPALLEFVVTSALGYALQRCREEGMAAETGEWAHGHCPLCGSLPVMGALAGEEGRKMLQCGTCATSWEHPRLACPHCGNTDHQTLEYFTTEGEPAHRVNICRKCSCYLKVVDRRGLQEDVPLDIEDIATLHLDLLAQKEGFTRGKRGIVP